MGWKLFRVLRWTADSTKPALNKTGALIYPTDTKRLWVSLASGWFGVDTPPIGATYMQFPGKSDPGTLWPNSTWNNISSETLLAGRVPRVEGTVASGGGNIAAAFGSSQDDQMQGFYVGIDFYNDGSTGSYKRCHTTNGSGSAQGRAYAGGPIAGDNGTLRTGDSTRDASVTVRVWQRTA